MHSSTFSLICFKMVICKFEKWCNCSNFDIDTNECHEGSPSNLRWKWISSDWSKFNLQYLDLHFCLLMFKSHASVKHTESLYDENAEEEDDDSHAERVDLEWLPGLLELTRQFVHLRPFEAASNWRCYYWNVLKMKRNFKYRPFLKWSSKLF